MCEELRYTEKIASLNDEFRRTGNGGRLSISKGVLSLGHIFVAQALQAIAAYDAFDDEDPYTEHDSGFIFCEGVELYFKIEAYDTSLRYGSPNPTDPNVSVRVLYVMHYDEYRSKW